MIIKARTIIGNGSRQRGSPIAGAGRDGAAGSVGDPDPGFVVAGTPSSLRLGLAEFVRMATQLSMCRGLAQATDLRGNMQPMLTLTRSYPFGVNTSCPLAAATPRSWPSLRQGVRLGHLLLVLGALALGLSGCGGHTEFDLTQNILEQRIPGGAGGGALTTFLPAPITFGFNVDQEAKSRKAQGPTQSVTLNVMQFQITTTGTPAGGYSSFEFLNSVTIYLESTRANSSLPRIPIATLPAGAGRTLSIALGTQPDNMLPYVTEGARLTSSATGTVPSHDITFVGQFSVHVRAL